MVTKSSRVTWTAVAIALLGLTPPRALAHCDGLDGPVVKAAPLVRVHRAGEGAPFTGLKPAGRDLGPAIPAADEAVRVGSVEPVPAVAR